MRRVLIFSLAYYPKFIGGAEVAVKHITDLIPPEEIEFDMITVRQGQAAVERLGNVNVYRVGFGGSRNDPVNSDSRISIFSKIFFVPLAYWKSIELQSKREYSAVWAIMASYGGFVAHLFKRKYKKVPLLLTIQEGEKFERRKGFFKPLFRRIFKSADRIQAISNFLADWAKEMGAACPIEVVPNAVDFEIFSKPIGDEEKRKIRMELGVSESETLLVTTSRLTAKNAVGDVILAVKDLPTTVKFLVIGNGELESILKSQAHSMQLESRVIFKGFISHEELPKYLQASDIFVRPSMTEGLGNSFLEAMAAGIPVIGTKAGGIKDFLFDGETGLVCEISNPRSIAQKVNKLMKDSEARDYMILNARKMIKEKYGWLGVAGKMRRLLATDK